MTLILPSADLASQKISAAWGLWDRPLMPPFPRFHQAAAHLSNSLGAVSSKKPPLSEQLCFPCTTYLLSMLAGRSSYLPSQCMSLAT